MVNLRDWGDKHGMTERKVTTLCKNNHVKPTKIGHIYDVDEKILDDCMKSERLRQKKNSEMKGDKLKERAIRKKVEFNVLKRIVNEFCQSHEGIGKMISLKSLKPLPVNFKYHEKIQKIIDEEIKGNYFESDEVN